MVSLNATIFTIILKVNGLIFFFFKFAFLSVPANCPSFQVAFKLCLVKTVGSGRQWAACPSSSDSRPLLCISAGSKAWLSFLVPSLGAKGFFWFQYNLWRLAFYPFLCCSQSLPWSGREWFTGVFCLSCSGRWSPPCINAEVFRMKERGYMHNMEGIK